MFDRVFVWREYPCTLHMDNGPEFISTILADWAEDHTVDLEFIQPGKPTQNAYIERFKRNYRMKCGYSDGVYLGQGGGGYGGQVMN